MKYIKKTYVQGSEEILEKIVNITFNYSSDPPFRINFNIIDDTSHTVYGNYQDNKITFYNLNGLSLNYDFIINLTERCKHLLLNYDTF